MEKVKIVFRKFKDNGDIIALFPEIRQHGDIQCYEHIGQHGTASPLIVRDTTPATSQEYAPLLKEIQSIYEGCELIARKRLHR